MPQSFFQRLKAKGNLPTPPGVVVQLLELSRRPDVGAKELAQTIAGDPGLSAKVLRFANSPVAGTTREVTSLQQAVGLMGVRGVQMMALSCAVVVPGNAQRCKGFDTALFSLQSLATGVAARVLAEGTQTGPVKQEAFVAGLLSQYGRAVIAASCPQEYSEKVLSPSGNCLEKTPELERAAFGETYATVGAKLLRGWGIPEPICNAIDHFRTEPLPADAPDMSRVLRVAELISMLVCGTSGGGDARPVFEKACAGLGLAEPQVVDMLKAIALEVEQARKVFDLPAIRLRTPEELGQEVRERVAELSLALQLENQDMVRQKEDLMRRATTDALTKISNRAAFDARFSHEVERSARTGESLSLLMIDIDRFKSINDTYGHPLGDRVLQAVAASLEQGARKIDFVARYGGEEFAVIAPSTPAAGAEILAERLREDIEKLKVPWEGKTIRVTVSVGVALLADGVGPESAAKLIAAADAELYHAKRAGRNRVCMRSRLAPIGAT